MASAVVSQQRVEISNKHGEKLVGVLHSTSSNNLVILCHGFRSTKDEKTILNLTAALTRDGMSVFRFDFAGNGESEGEFQYGNYRKEADDLHAVVLYFKERNFKVSAICGHSKGKVEFRVTEDSLMDRLTTDMLAACHAIDKQCRILTIHGSADEIVPSEDALKFNELIPNHKLHIVEGADHCYTAHQELLASLVLEFIKSNQVAAE
ncbi:hypothetical protein HPP92_009526 [Vanilla planifolia]|uniref:Serine aminopeptidase S33 domain-containing protein n=1 Tax=Vanilla planifolia TaxID=51239 RepID=A0A835R7Z2_VANPL|nr:hypothetical protein HPP92_009731 [Vanilla planifolia]KAG0487431.1 hypothetical protein HPP92_009526 [Vanilla planifolia]